MIYELIGRLVIEAVRRQFGRQIRIAAIAAAAVTALGVGAYLATREGDSEG
ncbi:MAG TPA: hypothetical protein VF052_02265 [Solirubrobacterales bacterium]